MQRVALADLPARSRNRRMRFRRRHLPVLVLAASLAVPAAAGANDLPNGSFESGLEGWSALNARVGVANGGPSGAKFARARRRSPGEFGLSHAGGRPAGGPKHSVRASLRHPAAERLRPRPRAAGLGRARLRRHPLRPCHRRLAAPPGARLHDETRRHPARPLLLRQGPRHGARGRGQLRSPPPPRPQPRKRTFVRFEIPALDGARGAGRPPHLVAERRAPRPAGLLDRRQAGVSRRSPSGTHPPRGPCWPPSRASPHRAPGGRST